jgi:hypothetical protein
MNEPLSERLNQLAESLELTDDGSRRALRSLAFMAAYKYDHYEMFQPGGRFLDHLGRWLRQFDVEDRPVALEMLQERLIFISHREMQELAHFLYYNVLVPEMLGLILRTEHLPDYAFRTAFDSHFRRYLRRTLFIGLSDGSRIDYFRRHHIHLSQEQVIPYYRSPNTTYTDELRKDTGDAEAAFCQVILIDDFTASGYTLLHRKDDGSLDGSLVRLYNEHKEVIDSASQVLVAYYIASRQAMEHVTKLAEEAPYYAGRLRFVTAMCLEDAFTVKQREGESDLNPKIRQLCEKYYRAEFETINTRKGGNILFGFGGSALTLSMHSNTPNNSIYLLWLHQEAAGESPGFYPLFRRIDRHRLG